MNTQKRTAHLMISVLILACGLITMPVLSSNEIGVITPLDFRVIDSEYSKSLNLIVMVPESENALHIFDLSDNRDITVPLLRTPICASVSPDGLFAAVGHDALISYIDLKNCSVIKTFDLTAEAFDIVLAGNGWIYVVPDRDQWVELHAVNINTGDEVLGSGGFGYSSSIYEKSLIKLNPDGNSLYSLDPSLSPQDLQKIDISEGEPIIGDDSPYHGDYDMCSNLWMSEDGNRIFTACGNIFRASSNPDKDMTYNGRLSGINVIETLAHAAIIGKVLVIPKETYSSNEDASKIVVFDYNNLTRDLEISLPSFPDRTPSKGRFIFANNSSPIYYVIVQADDEFGVATGELLFPIIPHFEQTAEQNITQIQGSNVDPSEETVEPTINTSTDSTSVLSILEDESRITSEGASTGTQSPSTFSGYSSCPPGWNGPDASGNCWKCESCPPGWNGPDADCNCWRYE